MVASSPANSFSLQAFHHRYRSRIIDEWVEKLKKEAGEQYAARPREELQGTISRAFEANHHYLIDGNLDPINRFIDRITDMRLKSGFLLSDVQKAFELYRTIVLPLLAREAGIDEFLSTSEKINQCLAYTIHRFSDHFQGMHEKEIMAHNRQLKHEVAAKTKDLRESELKYKILVEEINDGYFVIRDQAIVFANRAFCRMHDCRLDEVLGRKFYLFLAPPNRKRVIDIYTRSLEKQPAPSTFEYMRLTKNGEIFPTEITAKVVTYEGRPANIGICRDITERVKMEEKVRETERMAYIGQITASLSHEIRNPLSAVKMNLQILEKNKAIKGNDQRRIHISTREVIRVERILNQLLDFAKPVQITLSPIDINQALNSCVETLDVKLKEQRLSVVLSLDKSIPVFQADGARLEQAFFNLLLNAMEASTTDGTVWISSILKASESGPAIEIVIEDEGNGIEEKYMPEIFKPFFSTKTKGTGLGLPNVDRIVQAHGGQVHAEKRDGNGATFRVHLPIR